MVLDLARKISLGNLQQCRVPTFVLCSDTEILLSIRHCPAEGSGLSILAHKILTRILCVMLMI